MLNPKACLIGPASTLLIAACVHAGNDRADFGVKASGLSPSRRESAVTTQSISRWTACNGTSGDTQGVARAFEAASHGAFTLIVNCPVRLHIGTDISRTIFIDDGTSVQFTGAGKFTVNNVMLPAFVIANSNGIRLTDWNVEYDASLPVDSDVRGYENAGRFVRSPGRTQPSAAFNDLRITPWLTNHRGIIFDRRQGPVNSIWANPTNSSAVFFIIGDSSNISVTGMRLYAPTAAGGDRFVPMVFSLSRNFKSNQVVTAKTPFTAEYVAVPHNLVFSNIDLDGTYMGWQGNVRDVHIDHVRSHRYGDLQDASGANVGGIGKWFAPPHLFYLNYDYEGDPALFNKDIHIHDVIDDGTRVGVARDKGGNDTLSGYALSLKIGCAECVVNGYKTYRPDGFLDLLPSNGLTISNVDATFNSAFLNNIFPGWRFPIGPYSHVTFNNIALVDTAASSVQPPIGHTYHNNEALVFHNVRVSINLWTGQSPLAPTISGKQNDVSLDYTIRASASRLLSAQNGTVSLTLQATPATLRAGRTVALTWTSTAATSCSARGAWGGDIETSGSRDIYLSSPGDHDFALSCRNLNDSANATMKVVVLP